MKNKPDDKRRPASEWTKAVKIEMIRRDWDMGDLAKAIGRSREYASAVVNERIRTATTAQAISDILNIPNTAYSNW